MKTFARTLGHPLAVWQAVEILDGLTFRGPVPTISRGALLRTHWMSDGSRGATFREIANEAGLRILTVKNEHAAILRRLREYLGGQPPTPPGMDEVGT